MQEMLRNSYLAPYHIKYRLNAIELSVVRLMKYYEHLRREYNNDSFLVFSRQKDIRQSKSFHIFENIVSIASQKDTYIPDPELYIKSQFEMMKRQNYRISCPPKFLIGPQAIARYKKYVDELSIDLNSKVNIKKLKKRTRQKEIMQLLSRTYQFTKKINLEVFGQVSTEIKRIFEEDQNVWLYISHVMIDRYFLSISQSVGQIDQSQITEELIKQIPAKLHIYSEEILNDPRLIEKAMRLFGDEVNGKLHEE